MLMRVPVGYRFDPTGEELISSYLYPKVMGFQLRWNVILDKDIYGKNTAPWIIFRDVDSYYWHTPPTDVTDKEVTKVIYVFTKLSNVGSGPDAKNRQRTTGSGTWKGQGALKEIRDSSGRVIGSSNTFTFERPKNVPKSTGRWSMHEYVLDGVYGSRENNLALCKITLRFKKKDQLQQWPLGAEVGEPSNKRCAEEERPEHKKQRFFSPIRLVGEPSNKRCADCPDALEHKRQIFWSPIRASTYEVGEPSNKRSEECQEYNNSLNIDQSLDNVNHVGGLNTVGLDVDDISEVIQNVANDDLLDQLKFFVSD